MRIWRGLLLAFIAATIMAGAHDEHDTIALATSGFLLLVTAIAFEALLRLVEGRSRLVKRPHRTFVWAVTLSFTLIGVACVSLYFHGFTDRF